MTAPDFVFPVPRPPAPALIGYAPGVFDLFHVGHLNLLRRARLACDHLIAGVVSDEVAMAQKGKRPVVPEAERLEIVSAVRCVDEVYLEPTTDKLATWDVVRFTVIFKGDDWVGSPKWIRLGEEFAARGVDLVFLPYTDHLSSTLLRDQDGVPEGRPTRLRLP